ncbi:penicillin-binding protein [Lysinibacillus sp. 54212]|uniref:penicillin-binding protein n=1 Tax=Lysinibacillus sp. 54212 TaxID=3119829 RepID=UPI003FA5FEF7
MVLFCRFFYIQSTGEVKGYSLQAEAANKYARETVLAADRGRILDRNSNVIVEDTLSYRLIAVMSEEATKDKENPRHVVDPAETAKVLSQYIELDEEKIYEQLMVGVEKDRYQVEFGVAGRSISHEVKAAIEEHDLPGINFASEKKRYYPNGSFASHLIGYATKDEQKDGSYKTVGKMGLELTYNKELTGKNGKVEYESDRFGYLLSNSEKMIQPAQDGNDIYLTIDKTIQNFLDEAMTRVDKEYGAESMVAVVADPKTGEILAMSQRPTFDPDDRIGLETNWYNDVVENVLEPGSTMKTFTLAAAIETGNWDPNTPYQSGRYKLYDNVVSDYNEGRGWGTITFLQGIQRSSNTMIANLLEIMGGDTVIEYFDKFGFGHKTGINLPNEASGTIVSKQPFDRLTSAFGQNSTVTPIQLIQAMTAIANDGEMMQPYVIDKIVDPNTGKTVQNTEPKVKGNPISAETAKRVREILATTVTAEKGTAKPFQMDGYEVSGKTGTAQIPRKTGTGYLKGGHNYIYSFLGMAPADDPQLIMYVAVKKPQMSNSIPGSEPVSKIFNSVMQNSLKYLNIDPEDTAQVAMDKIPNVVGKSAEDIALELTNKGVKPVIIGEGGEIKEQYPKANLSIMKDSIVFLKTDGPSLLPSFKGWSLRNMLVYKALSQLPIEIVGEGFVESQSVSENTVITDSSPIVVKLKTPKDFLTSPQAAEEEQEEQLPQD